MLNLELNKLIKPDLNEDQRNGLRELHKFMKSDDKFFMLTGAAGTGKTHLLCKFFAQLKNTKICVSAPTNRAVRVIEKATGIKGLTLHKLHGLQPNVELANFDVDNVIFDAIGESKFNNYDVIGIDEGSMMTDSIITANERKAKLSNIKIIIAGDKYQLPPVDKNKKLEQSKCFNYNGFELTTIVRQNMTNSIHKVFELVKSDIDNGTITAIQHLKKQSNNINSNGEGYATMYDNSFNNLIKTYIKYKNYEDFRYTAYTNTNVMDWNRFLRNAKNNKTSKDKSLPLFLETDYLMGYTNIVNSNNEYIIINSDEYKVEMVRPRKNEQGIDCYNVLIKNLHSDTISTINVVNHLSPTFAKYKQEVDILYARANFALTDKKVHWAKFNDYIRNNINAIDVELTGNGLYKKTISKAIDYGYGVTTHKLQGSTIETVFINLKDILYNCNIKTYNGRIYTNMLLYTALSRCSKACFILI